MLEESRQSMINLIKRFRSKLGVAMSLAYWAICLLTTFALFVSAPDSMSILAPLFLTSPWSFLLLEAVPENLAAAGGPVAFVLIFVVSAAINTAILYLLGWLLTRVVAPLKK